MTPRIGVALLGCAHSSHAWAYARALVNSPKAELVGVYDADARLTDPVVRDFGVSYVSDADALVSRPDVEAVVVCSSTVEHRTLVELAARQHCAVLCEKPIATTLVDAQAMITVCATAGVRLQMAFVSRFHPLVRDIRNVLRDAELGAVLGVVAGNRGRPPLPPAYPEWITDPAQAGGGALIDHSVHLTDVLRHLLGRDVVRVSAETEMARDGLGVEDLALLLLTFHDGVVASLDPSWSVPADNPWDYDFFLRIVGTEGAVSIDDLGPSLRITSDRYGAGMRLVPFGADVDAMMIDSFLDSVRAGRVLPPGATGEDGLRALEVALAGYQSAATGQPVTMTR